jgi:hypothetical protein
MVTVLEPAFVALITIGSVLAGMYFKQPAWYLGVCLTGVWIGWKLKSAQNVLVEFEARDDRLRVVYRTIVEGGNIEFMDDGTFVLRDARDFWIDRRIYGLRPRTGDTRYIACHALTALQQNALLPKVVSITYQETGEGVQLAWVEVIPEEREEWEAVIDGQNVEWITRPKL